MTGAPTRNRAASILDRLEVVYAEDRPLLHYRNEYELLIGVILSAQTTDAQVNSVTPQLFSAYPRPCLLADADINDIERIIRRTGFFRTKARNIRATAHDICSRFDSVVPQDMEALVSLPGVGRKSANVVRGALFGKPAIIVDTHFARVTRRLELTGETNPTRLEHKIGALLPPSRHYSFSMRINYHGRDTCHARNPDCGRCVLRSICPFPNSGESLPET